MAVNPRTRRQSDAHRARTGPRPPSAADPRRPSRRRPAAAPSRPPGPSAALEAVLDEFTETWGRGDRPRAEGYLAMLPAGDSAELIYHEYCLAEASDLHPDPADYLRRFPDHAESLRRLFSLHGALTTSTLRRWAGPADLPEAGDEIGPYRLIRELGRGAFARVFLAEEADLDHRPVVLKVSTRATAEPRLLARARHAHTVEVLRQAVADDGALHLICMPFLGGATLAAVLDARRASGRRPRSGLDLLADLDRASAPEYPAAGLDRPARQLIAGLAYPEALAWIAARLAEALDHAHRRGVAHGDLKPSNVLMTAEGTPMLIDFNLAVDWRDPPDVGPAADPGGTVAYMAPERLRAIAGADPGRAQRAEDAHRADLYALGLILLESLTGLAPEVPRCKGGVREAALALAGSRRDLPGPLRKRGWGRGAIPAALRSILARCLAPDPATRYARGDQLAEDLDCYRAGRPLAFAATARHSDLIRRARGRRAALVAGAMTLASAVAVGAFASTVMQGTKSDRARAKLAAIVSRADSDAFRFRRFGDWRPFDRGDPSAIAARRLALYGVATDPDWRARDDVRFLPDRERAELEAWLLEQALRLAVALGERPNSPVDWRRALALLERADLAPVAAFRPAIRDLRHRLKLPDPEPADGPRPPRWMEDYLAGVAAEPLHAREALGHYLDALRGRPGLFWGHYRAAAVACRIDEYPIAAEHLRACVARYPENPALHVGLASALFKVEQDTPWRFQVDPSAASQAECDRALALDPDFVVAYSTRAMIRRASWQDEGAVADLDRFAVLTRPFGPAGALMLRFQAGLHYGPNYPDDGKALIASTRQILAADPEDPDTRAILAAGLALGGHPADAIAEYDRVLDAEPGHLRARYQRADLRRRVDPARPIAELASLIEDPRFEELFCEEPTAIRAFHHVAEDLLRRGRIAEALEMVGRSLLHANRSRTFRNEMILARNQAGNQAPISPRGEAYYRLARIHATAARADRDRLPQVVEDLGLAFAASELFEDGWFAIDPTFEGLRGEIRQQMRRRPLRR